MAGDVPPVSEVLPKMVFRKLRLKPRGVRKFRQNAPQRRETASYIA